MDLVEKLGRERARKDVEEGRIHSKTKLRDKDINEIDRSENLACVTNDEKSVRSWREKTSNSALRDKKKKKEKKWACLWAGFT